MKIWSNLNFQNSNSPLMEQLIFFHDHSMLILILIITMVSYLMISMMFNNFFNYFLLTSQTVEIIWTIIPSIILLFIALPSLKLLYLLEESNKPAITFKTLGHQWWWKYEFSNFCTKIESFMIDKKSIKNHEFRLLDVDNRIILPFKYPIRNLVSAVDVLHSWTIPSLGVKIDANPGRLNQLNFTLNKSGIFFGQCSEICGANHSFMPIAIESISIEYFLKWMMNNELD